MLRIAVVGAAASTNLDCLQIGVDRAAELDPSTPQSLAASGQ